MHVLCSESQLNERRQAWERLQSHPNVDWEFFRLINSVRQVKPCVLELREGNETRSIWVGRIEDGEVELPFGYMHLRIKVRRLNIINGGIMGDDSIEACRLLLKRAIDLLAEQNWDMLVFSYLSCETPMFELASKAPMALCRDWSISPGVHWTMTLPDSLQEILSRRSSRHRSHLKGLPRRLEARYPDRVRVRVFREPSEADDFCRDAAEVGRESYQSNLGDSLRADDEYRSRCKLLADRGALRGYVLYIDGRPCAYWMATLWDDAIHLNVTGYCPTLRNWELGTILLLRLFEDHCGATVRKVDFGHGDAVYKERFGDKCFLEASVHIYRASLRGVLLNLIRSGLTRTSRAISRIMARLGLLQRVKSMWRRSLSGSQAQTRWRRNNACETR